MNCNHFLYSSLATLQGPAADDLDMPRADARLGWAAAILFFIIFLGWAALIPLDAASVASGQLVVAGQRQTVQHRDGGVVEEIHVKEGQRVEKGQLLIRLAGAEVEAQDRMLAIQMINLKAQKARLEAEQSGSAAIAWPAEFLGPNGPLEANVRSAIQMQTQEFLAGKSLLAVQSEVLKQVSAQALESAGGYKSQMGSTAEQEKLVDEELALLRTVADKGYVAKTRLRALERAKAELHGRRGGFQASEAEAKVAANTNRLRGLEAVKAYREKAATELREVEAALNETAPKYRAAYQQLENLSIRAPATGKIVGLSIFTVGGVIAPGRPLMDLVPEEAELVVSARFSVDDGDDLKVGQAAQLRFTGLPARGLPILNATVRSFSADSFVDEKTGISFYTAELTVGQHDLAVVRRELGADFEFRPGMPVSVVIPLRKRTALQYALEPLWDTIWLSFREH